MTNRKHQIIKIICFASILLITICFYIFVNNIKNTNFNTNNNSIKEDLILNRNINNTTISTSNSIEDINGKNTNDNENYRKDLELSTNINNSVGNTSDENLNATDSYRNVSEPETTDLDESRLIEATDNFVNAYFFNKDKTSRKQQLSTMLDLDYIKKYDNSIFSYDIDSNFTDSMLITPDKYFKSKTKTLCECNYSGGGKTQVGITYQRAYTADDDKRTIVNQTITDYYYIQISDKYKIQNARLINSSSVNN